MENFQHEESHLPSRQSNQPLDRSPASNNLLPKRPNAFKACEACRAAKSRCSAQLPSCQRCERRNRPCVYRDALRRRPGASLLPISAPTSPCPTLDRSSDFVRGNHEGTDCTVYYWIHSLFQGPGVPGHQQRALAFASPVSPWDLLPITTASITDLQYLSPYFATRCFDIFASSFWHLNPFCPINLLHVALCDLLGVVGSPNISSSVDRANVLAVLAIGVSCTERFPLADYLHRKSRQYAEQEEGNKLSVLQHQLLQISFPKPSFHPVSDCSQLTRQQHAQYHLNMNQHGFAYTILTNARRGHLIGRQSTEFGSGRTSTVVTLNAFAQLLSLCVGCLPDYPDENGMIPSNDQLRPALSGINQFARIASQIGQIQQKWGRHPETLAHASFELYRPLQLALLDVSNRCRLLYAQDPQQRVEVEVLICVMLHYVIQILFRPFLMMKLLYLYRVQLQFPDETSSPQWFDLAGAYTVRAARAIIGLIGQAFDFGSVVKDLPGNGFFLESACVSLILMCLCDGPREAYLGDIWLGMYHMSRMSCQALVKERIQSLMGLLAITGLAGVRNYQV